MNVRIAYGKGWLSLDLPSDNVSIIEPAGCEGLQDERAALIAALDGPVAAPSLRDWWSPGRSVCIVFTDITRATPNDRLIPWLLDYLHQAGVPRDAIALLNSTYRLRRVVSSIFLPFHQIEVPWPDTPTDRRLQ